MAAGREAAAAPASVGKLTSIGALDGSELASGVQDAKQARMPSAGAVKFRVPEGGSIAAILKAGKVPQASLERSISTCLERMKAEGKLKSADPVADLMKKIFPGKGKFDQKAFEDAVDVADRSRIYKTVADAEAKVAPADKAKLAAAIDDAMSLCDVAIADATGLKEVFGSMAATAKANYGKAKSALGKVKTGMATQIDVDYNGDDAQTGLGGWADFGSQHIHLQGKIAKVDDKDDSAITLVHEASHLSDPSVDDHGYYGSAGFFEADEATKVGNAAHYEELVRRARGKSKFAGKTFTPGVSVGGGAMTFVDEVKKGASEYFRKAWDKAVDVHQFLRNVKLSLDGGSTAQFKSKEARILEISKLEKLTIHEQAKPSTINLNDIALSEGVPRIMTALKKTSQSQAVPAAPVAPKVKADYVEDVIKATIGTATALTGNAVDDRALTDWLVANYRKAI